MHQAMVSAIVEQSLALRGPNRRRNIVLGDHWELFSRKEGFCAVGYLSGNEIVRPVRNA